MKITRNEAIAHILGSGGSFISLEFEKRTTGELRKMTCRRGVKKHLANGPPAYNPTEHNLIWVWETPASNPEGCEGKELYRSINVPGLRRIVVNGEWVEVSD